MTWSRIGAAVALAGAIVLVWSGCSREPVSFKYPGESLVFPNQGVPPGVYVDFVNDLRLEKQRTGTEGRFPADRDWDAPASQIYYQALTQDLTQTNALAVVSLREQADFILEIDLIHFGCLARRNIVGWVLTGILGAGAGVAVGQSVGAGAVGAVVGVAAIPVPTVMRAVCEVRLRVYDREHHPIWEERCFGEITKRPWLGMTTRKEQEWVDRYLTVAVKRCNACLVGQLRQALVGHDIDE